MSSFVEKLLLATRTVSTIMAWISGLLFLLLAFYMTLDASSRSLGGPFTGVADQFASFTLALGGTWALAGHSAMARMCVSMFFCRCMVIG